MTASTLQEKSLNLKILLEILKKFRTTLSSLAVPTFAIDLPEGGGKVALQPDYRINGKYQDIHGKKLIAYETSIQK